MTAQKDWLEKDFYQTLGVSESSSAKEITKTYRKLARKLHPDANPNDKEAETKFKEVSAAYDVIGDEKKRSEYDELRRLGPLGNGFNSGSTGFNSGGIPFDISDIFGNFFGNQPDRGSQRGLDIEATLPLSFLDAVNGVTTTLTLGSQKDKGSTSVRVKIPSGVENGQRVRVKGKGQSGPAGSGDLFVIVQVEPHDFFGREGKNLTLVTRVTFPQLVLGSEVKVDTLDGSKVTLRIPPGTPNGRTFRVKGGGVSTSRGLGDLLVTVEVEIPTQVSDKEVSLIEELADVMAKKTPKD